MGFRRCVCRGHINRRRKKRRDKRKKKDSSSLFFFDGAFGTSAGVFVFFPFGFFGSLGIFFLPILTISFFFGVWHRLL
jgi:hypothetical protein